MVNIEGEILINRPVEEVFDVVADERNEPRYNPRLLWVQKISSGPIGRGTRFRAATKTVGRPIEMTIEFTAYERPRRLGSSTHMPTMEIRGALAFDPAVDGTRMRWSWELQPRGISRLLTPLVGRMGERQEEIIWAGLKEFMETREGSVPSPPEELTPGPTLEHASGGGRPLPLKERIEMRIEHEVDTRSVGLAAVLIRLTKGRLARLWRREVLLLTTRGRKSGKERTVPLQFFPDGEGDMVVVAANSGLSSPPGWYFNLTADPLVRVEVGGHTMRVRAEELSAEEAAAFWPHVLRIAPDYARYPRRTGRRIPMIRLVPTTPSGLAAASGPSFRNAGLHTTEIAPGVYWLRMGRGITGSNVYFVRSGSSLVLIDTSWPWCARSIGEAAESLFGAGTRPAAILLTHIHLDHAGSALELAHKWDCPVYVHPDELPFAAPALPIIERYANPLDRRVILPLLRAMPRRRAGPASSTPSLEDVTRALDPGAAVPGLPGWECISTPGHTPGHVSYFRERDRVLISGDALSTMNLNSPKDILLQKQKLSGPPYISTWNWRVAKDSVAALARLGPRVVAGGHGTPMAGPDTARNLRAFGAAFSGAAERGETS